MSTSRGGVIGESEAIRRVLALVEQVAPWDSTVLITGEMGTGKELVAMEIHILTPRRTRTMVKVNCFIVADTNTKMTNAPCVYAGGASAQVCPTAAAIRIVRQGKLHGGYPS